MFVLIERKRDRNIYQNMQRPKPHKNLNKTTVFAALELISKFVTRGSKEAKHTESPCSVFQNLKRDSEILCPKWQIF